MDDWTAETGSYGARHPDEGADVLGFLLLLLLIPALLVLVYLGPSLLAMSVASRRGDRAALIAALVVAALWIPGLLIWGSA